MDEFDSPEFMEHMRLYLNARRSPAVLTDTSSYVSSACLNDSLDEALNPHLYDRPPRPHRNWSFDSLDEAIKPQLYFQPYQQGGALADHIDVSRTFDQHVRRFDVQGQAFRVLSTVFF
jgi:hypothetical protein